MQACRISTAQTYSDRMFISKPHRESFLVDALIIPVRLPEASGYPESDGRTAISRTICIDLARFRLLAF